MVPGTRFALGSRLGSPALVEPLEDGASTASAACQPSSAGEDQRLPAAAVGPEEPGVVRPPLNQCDSTEAKIGSPTDFARSATGGIITPPSDELVSRLTGAAVAIGALTYGAVWLTPDADQDGSGSSPGARV